MTMTGNESLQFLINWLNESDNIFSEMSDYIWQNPELAFQEHKAARIQAEYLQKEGFSVAWNIGGISTAFVAEWGQGRPIIGFLGEYDALPGLSQKAQTSQEAILEGRIEISGKRASRLAVRSFWCDQERVILGSKSELDGIPHLLKQRDRSLTESSDPV